MTVTRQVNGATRLLSESRRVATLWRAGGGAAWRRYSLFLAGDEGPVPPPVPITDAVDAGDGRHAVTAATSSLPSHRAVEPRRAEPSRALGGRGPCRRHCDRGRHWGPRRRHREVQRLPVEAQEAQGERVGEAVVSRPAAPAGSRRSAGSVHAEGTAPRRARRTSRASRAAGEEASSSSSLLQRRAAVAHADAGRAPPAERAPLEGTLGLGAPSGSSRSSARRTAGRRATAAAHDGRCRCLMRFSKQVDKCRQGVLEHGEREHGHREHGRHDGDERVRGREAGAAGGSDSLAAHAGPPTRDDAGYAGYAGGQRCRRCPSPAAPDTPQLLVGIGDIGGRSAPTRPGRAGRPSGVA